jgi:hypothetical protein
VNHAVIARSTRPTIIKLFPGGEGRVLKANNVTVTVLTYQPGWRWSRQDPNMISEQWCRHGHQGYLQSGRMAVEFPDGSIAELSAGDAFELPPGHDQWTVGNEPCCLIEFAYRG